MKHILPILTAALALMASTAFAEYSPIRYYEDYIVPAENNTTNPGQVYFTPQSHNITISSKVDTYQDYNVIRTTLPDQGFGHDTAWRIQVTGEKVDFYLTDYIDTGDLGSSTNNDSLIIKGIKQIGYRYLESNTVPKGTYITKDIEVDSKTTEEYLFGQDKKNGWKETLIEEPNPTSERYDNIHTVTRNHYYLGTFNEGDVIEVYMSRFEEESYVDGKKGVWSTSTLYTGGYGEGVTEATDQLAVYLAGGSWEAGRKAMPLASLTPEGGSRVFFGIQASAVGSPLPGGLPLALIAGFFGLGFWYVRRRKAIAA